MYACVIRLHGHTHLPKSYIHINIHIHIHIQGAPMADRLLAQNHLSVHKRLKKVAAIEDQRAQV